jgi:hypothetical protein
MRLTAGSELARASKSAREPAACGCTFELAQPE